ncbi:MAG TPA: heme exporter protein CcmB, partial [Fodinibius sp.]|nr:heme exporter protein CcmB [Fodinibius sp.]
QAAEVFLGKLCFNYLFTLAINVTTFLGYLFLLDISIADLSAFLLILILGTAGLSSVATMLGAIVSQADRKGAIFSVLSIPLLFPLILILARLTQAALIADFTESYFNDALALTGFVGSTITAGLLLFDYIWDE